MQYIAITIVAISITIYAVYKIANGLFRLQLRLKPLLMCALFAVVLSIVLPRFVVGFAGLAGTIGVLAVFAVLFAYFVTYYDESQEPQVSAASATLASCTSDASAVASSLPEEEEENFNLPASVERLQHISNEDESNEDEASIMYAVHPASQLSSVSAANECSLPINCEIAAASEATIPTAHQEVTSLLESSSPLDEFILPDSLDELLDLAFQYKEQQDFLSALKYFRAVLKHYPESEAAPFVVVEVANILKNRGSYDEAIKVFTEGRALPGLQADNALAQEFTDTIAYLRIVRNMLLERRLGFIPYHKIPDDVCKDIDMEFREWRNLA